MGTIPQVRSAMQTTLGREADRIAWETRFCQRQSAMSGSKFVQMLVFSSLGAAQMSYPELQRSALSVGVAISKQGLAQRFGARSADLCRQVLGVAVGQVIDRQTAVLPLLQRFAGIYLRDSSVIRLPKQLQDVWSGVGDSRGETAAVKLQIRLEYSGGQLAGPVLQAGRVADRQSPYQDEDLPVHAVRLGDLGYFSVKRFVLDQRQQVYTFSRYKVGVQLYDAQGQQLDVLSLLQGNPTERGEWSVYLGKATRFACRLLAIRVPQAVVDQRRSRLKEYARKKQVCVRPETLALAAWTLLITDIPAPLLSIEEALVLLTVRWQLELLFKLWKSLFHIDTWNTTNPWRILTELYARLISVVILHWTWLIELWGYPHRSLWKAALSVRHLAVPLALAFAHPAALEQVLTLLQSFFRHLCSLEYRRARLSTSYRLAACSPLLY